MKKRILYKLLLTLVFIGKYQCFANEVSGVIKDHAGLPIALVNVYESTTNQGVYSDEFGRFKLSFDKSGTYRIRFSQSGYVTQFKTVILSVGNEVVNVTLEKNRELKTVEVQGKTTGEIQKQKGFEVDIIKLDNVKNVTTDINQILKATAGINIRESGGLGSDFVLSLNGLSGNQIRYFINGIPMENFGSSLTLNNFPVGLIESVEVYKGAVPIHLSSDALGGAINIITNKELKPFFDVGYSVGSFNTHRFSLNSRHVFKRNSTLSFSSFINSTANNYWMDSIPAYDLELGNFEGFQSVQRWHDQYKSGMIKLEYVVQQKKWTDRLALGFTLAANRKNYQHPNNNLKRVFNDFHTINKTGLVSVNYAKHLKHFKITSFSTVGLIEENIVDTGSFKYNWNADFIQRDSTDPEGELFERKSHFVQTDFILRNQVGLSYRINDQHTLEAYYNSNYVSRKGGDLVNEFNRAFESPNYLKKDILSASYSYISPNKKVRSSLFSKQYWFTGKIITEDFEGNQITHNIQSSSLGYGLATSIELTKKLNLKTSFERAYRMPEAYEALGDGIYITPNPELLPERSFNYNLGLASVIQVGKWKVNSNFNSFYRLSSDFIRFNPLGPFGQFENLQRTNALGAELGASFNWNKRILFAGNATYQHITDQAEFDEGLLNTNYKSRVPNIPWFFANARVGYQLPLKNEKQLVGFTFSTRYVHAFFLKWESLGSASSKHIIPQQFVQDFNVEYSFANRKYNTALTIQNIFNQTVYDNFSIPRPGRAIYFKIRYQIINNKKAKNENAI